MRGDGVPGLWRPVTPGPEWPALTRAPASADPQPPGSQAQIPAPDQATKARGQTGPMMPSAGATHERAGTATARACALGHLHTAMCLSTGQQR